MLYINGVLPRVNLDARVVRKWLSKDRGVGEHLVWVELYFLDPEFSILAHKLKYYARITQFKALTEREGSIFVGRPALKRIFVGPV